MNKNFLPLKFFVAIGSVVLIILSTSWIERAGDGWLKRSSHEATYFGVRGAAAYHAMLKRNQITGQIDPKDVLNARKEVQNHLESPNRDFNMSWEFRGLDNVGGRTRALLIDKRDETNHTIFAGGVAGGVWKSTTSGLTWNRMNTPTCSMAVSCITQTDNGDIYVGTGEYFNVSNDFQISQYEGFIGHGILKSTDGVNFEIIPSTVPDISEGMDADWAYVMELAAVPGDGRLYAATNTGLKYLNSGGTEWLFAKTTEGEVLDTVSSDVHVAANGMVVASVQNWCYVSETGSPDGFVLQSTRFNPTPDSVVNPDKLPMENIARIEFAIAPSDNNVVYAMTARTDHTGTPNQDEFGELEGIYRSVDAGKTWELIGPGGSTNFNVLGSFYVDDGANQYYYLGFYDNVLAVHPQDAGIVYTGGFDMWEGIYTGQPGFFQWNQKSSSDLTQWPTFLHSSHHAYVFDPDNANICYIANDGGLFKTDDGFNTFKDLNKNYSITQCYSVGYNSVGQLLTGTQGSGVMAITGNGNTPENGFPMNIGGDLNGGYTEISMINPDILFFAGEKVNIRRWDNSIGAFTGFMINDIANPNAFITPFVMWESFNNLHSRDSVTYNAEENYNALDTIYLMSNNSYPYGYILSEPLAAGDSIRVQDPISNAFFIAVDGVLWMTRDALDLTVVPEWWKISNFEGLPLCVAYSDDANYAYVGTQEGDLYRIANIGLAYNHDMADISSPSCVISTSLVASFEGRAITSVAANPNNIHDVVLTLGNYGNDHYVYYSTNILDSVAEFNSIQANLPKMPAYSSLIEMNGGNIIIGAECGIWVTDNPGANTQWSLESEGMDIVPAFMLRQQTLSQYPINNYGVIYAATFGLGLFQSDRFVGIDDEPGSEVVLNNSLKLYPNPVSSSTTVSFELKNASKAVLNVYDINSRLVKHIELNERIIGVQELVIDCQDLVHGTYIMHLVAGKESAVTKFVVMK